MDREAIVDLIEHKHQAMIDWCNEHGPFYWTYGPHGKWTTAQHIVHLVQSTKPLNKALSVPKLALKMKFGKANRPSRKYEEVVKRYQEKLKDAIGLVSPFSKEMPDPTLNEMDEWLEKLTKGKDAQISLIKKKWKEKDLDVCLIPHPLMGRMLVREILMWSAYHTEHHLNLIKSRAKEMS